MAWTRLGQSSITVVPRSVPRAGVRRWLTQAWVRPTGQRWPTWIGAGRPRLAIWPRRPRAASSASALGESSPRSRCTVGGSDGLQGASWSRVEGSSTASWRLAGATTAPSGMPLASVRVERLILLPYLPRAYHSGRMGGPSTEVVTTLDDLEP